MFSCGYFFLDSLPGASPKAPNNPQRRLEKYIVEIDTYFKDGAKLQADGGMETQIKFPERRTMYYPKEVAFFSPLVILFSSADLEI